MAKTKHRKHATDSAEYYINRELSWLAFNQRVLEMAECESLPLLERMKFAAIFSSNLDEFFMIRVAGLQQQIDAGLRKRGLAGKMPSQQLAAISERTHYLVKRHTGLVGKLFLQLRGQGLCVMGRGEWTDQQVSYLRDYFRAEILPVLTPLSVSGDGPCPLLPGLQLNVALTLKSPQTPDAQPRLVVVPVPNSFSRFVMLPLHDNTFMVAIEDVIADNSAEFSHGDEILSIDFFRLTRDADVAISGDEASDLLDIMEAAIVERRRRTAVRLEISGGASKFLLKWLRKEYELKEQQIYEINGLLDAKSFWQIADCPGFEGLRYSDTTPQTPVDLIGFDSAWEAMSAHDVMMYHPYESFEPVVKLLQEAAEDPSVLAIKQTLYRTSGDSPIIQALENAAANGKEVTVLVELKARFDEARNVQWARRLEDAGCYVIYGIAGLKTHAKALLIIRRENGRIQRYVHLGTGNYNDKTAKLYSDLGLLSCDAQLSTDVAAFFNMLTGFSEAVGWSRLGIAPVNLKKRFIEMIEREVKASSADKPGLIMAKVNSLEDKEICKALYKASSKGVKILLNVRGICCLKPGIKGISENIEVVSVLGRYLEHARMFYFANGGHPEVYLSSADLMTRNLEKRFELLFPIMDPGHQKRCKDILETCFSANVHSWRLMPDGTYQPVAGGKKKIEAQQVFYEQVLAAQQNKLKKNLRFRPVRHKK